MNVLWLVNIPLPEASQLMGEKPSPFGGWLINASKDLTNKEDEVTTGTEVSEYLNKDKNKQLL